MQVSASDFDQLLREHHALMRDYQRAQSVCSERLLAQAREIERLQAQAMRLRAAVIQRDTALAWAREDRMELEQSIPGLPRRVDLARRVQALQARVHDLMRQPRATARPEAPVQQARPGGDASLDTVPADSLEASLAAADLVICQAGCMSHGAYWRVHDHCRRTGKTCVLVDKPDALGVVRIRRQDQDGGSVARSVEFLSD